MSKIGVSLKIDVSKIDKNRLFKGQKGTYLDCTVFIDPENPDQYENNGMITQDVSKQERDAGTRGEILGNCKVFWRDSQSGGYPNAPAQQDYRGHQGSNQANPTYEQGQNPINGGGLVPSFEDDCPF